MISHFNVIANVKQIQPFEQPSRDAIKLGYLDVTLGLVPFSHIYGLVGIAHISVYRGDSIVVLPKFVFKDFLGSVEKYKINTLSVVPPIIINLVKNKVLCDQFDLTSVRSVMTGAAPLGKETAQEFASQHPDWVTRQGYGMTETATAVTNTSPADVWFGSSGCLLSGVEAKVLSSEGVEITEYNKPGELLVKAPSIVLGYLNNPKANAETFIDMPEGRFLNTGDEVEFRGLQVAPAELEDCLLDHPAVADCAVIPVADERAGELPKAFIVKSPAVAKDDENVIKHSILKHVEKAKSRHKWLAGGLEFIDIIPKSPSGKILRRLLRDRERERRRETQAKL
ncbi:hypothetical protein LTR10_023664 [Elasticomyces elasticus]|uniref:Uncharacterized protein n=1 Tax=Exophiala sideris TaxID=1016849 RepID=A0ABR0IVM0_9EURO|nr:hypothetical protein LTR10_023664 [Elasticomyces elasticus]KAK5021518.1 hypothetical protein LTS07_010925 [Exophiala sideris]KAK5024562.1 hypothetical protein LTR13_010818 [Exophiala sideris]KAK5049653.1 hypothetical protein LTR69_010949 [Exophiala sideris]KAK5176634.1 hypothetical protein LTR44_010816 [Eurotiomycetes sp. CCFEE 6388]